MAIATSRQLALIAYLCFCDMLTYAMLTPVLAFLFLDTSTPLVPAAWGPYRPFVFGLYLATFSLVQMVAAPLWGVVCTRTSKKTVLGMAFFVNMVAYILGAAGVVRGSLALLFAGVVVAGSVGTALPILNALIAESSARGSWTRHFSLLGAITGLAFVLGPQITALFIDHYAIETIAVAVFLVCALAAANNLCWVFALPVRPVAVAAAEPAVPAWGQWLRDRDLQQLFLFQFLLSLAWYCFIKFFQVHLLENLQVDRRASCEYLSYLGAACAGWQGLRYLYDFSSPHQRWTVPATALLMLLGVSGLLYARTPAAVIAVIVVLSFAYSLLVPSSMSLLLQQGHGPATVKTSLFQALQAAAKILAPLLSGALFSATSTASALLATIATASACAVVWTRPQLFTLVPPESES